MSIVGDSFNIFPDDEGPVIHKRSKSSGSKALSFRSTSNGNIQSFGPHKSQAQLPKNNRLSVRKGKGSSSKHRAFGADLTTPNGNRSFSVLKSAKKKAAPASKAGPAPLRVKTKHPNIAPIEVCHKGSDAYMPVDLDIMDLLKTNKNAQQVFQNNILGSALGGSSSSAKSVYNATIAEDAAALDTFEIFNDEANDEDADIDMEEANLW